MNKIVIIGAIENIIEEDFCSYLIMKTSEATMKGGEYVSTPPPVRISEAALENMPKVEIGDTVLVKGHYEATNIGDNWQHEIVAYQVTDNLSLNIFYGTGNIGHDADLTTSNKALIFNLGCKRFYKGERFNDWIRCRIHGPNLDKLQNVLLKGRQSFVLGSLQHDVYKKDEDSEEKRSTSLAVRDWQVFSVRAHGE